MPRSPKQFLHAAFPRDSPVSVPSDMSLREVGTFVRSAAPSSVRLALKRIGHQMAAKKRAFHVTLPHGGVLIMTLTEDLKVSSCRFEKRHFAMPMPESCRQDVSLFNNFMYCAVGLDVCTSCDETG